MNLLTKRTLVPMLIILILMLLMLSIGALGQTTYHTRLAQEEYYDPNKFGERPGLFIGEGAELLGLRGTVSQEQVKSLMRGFHPETHEPLRQTAGRPAKHCAWDLVLSAPNKSFSIAWALAEDPEARAKLERAFHSTLEKLVKRIEDATYVRVGRDSKPLPAKPVITLFIHTSARPVGPYPLPGDPQYHAHLVVHKVAVRDGKTYAPLSRPYYVRKMALGTLARCCDLPVALQAEFPGLELAETHTGFEITGFPKPLLRHFSRRSQQIEAVLGDLQSETAAAKAFACLKTRDAKQHVPPLAELLSHWREEARRLGFDAQHVAEIFKARSPAEVNKPKVLADAFSTAVDNLTRAHSHFSELDLIRYTAQAATAKGVSGEDVVAHVAGQIRQSPNIVFVGKVKGRKRFSTPEILNEEKKVLGLAKQMADTQPSHRITFTRLCARLSLETARATRRWLTLESDPTLESDQHEALKSLASRSGQLAVLKTPAGTAKSDTLGRLGELYHAAGYTVLAAAPTGGAVRRLAEEADLPAVPLKTLLNLCDRDRSVAQGAKHAAKQIVREAAGRYIGLYPFKRRPLLSKDTVVIVDGAQRISTQDVGSLLKHCQRAGAKVLLVGSPDTLQTMERGAPFASISRNLPAAQLTKVVRPTRREDAKNLGRIPAGKAKEVVQDLALRGRLHVADSRDSAITKLLSDWQESGGTRNPKEHLIVVPDGEQAKWLNQLASETCRGGHKDTRTGDKANVILPSGEKVFPGDRMLCTRSDHRYGVLSGSLGTLVAVSRGLDAVLVEFDDGHRATLPLRTYPHVTRGYAVTVWQSQPTRHAYLLLGSNREDRQAAVVKLSLAAETTRAYVDRPNAGEQLEELVRQFSLDRTKTLATDIQAQSKHPKQER